MKYGILVDSGGIIIDDNAIKNTNIHVIPLHVILGDKTEFLDTPENIKKYDVFTRVSNKEEITTSMASPGELEVKYDEMLKKYDHILHITITPNLSGMKDVALMVTQDEKYTGKVTVIDHFTAANGIKYLALKMDEMIKSGITDLEEFKKIADVASDKIFLGLIPGDIKKLHRGGRGKGALISLLKFVKTKFLIQWGEKPKNIGISRTLKGIIEKTMTAGHKMSGDDADIILVSTIQTDPAYIELAKKEIQQRGFTYTQENIPSIYGCHAGTETLGVIMIPNEIKKSN
jgi:DegV family protein with EDD domain